MNEAFSFCKILRVHIDREQTHVLIPVFQPRNQLSSMLFSYLRPSFRKTRAAYLSMSHLTRTSRKAKREYVKLLHLQQLKRRCVSTHQHPDTVALFAPFQGEVMAASYSEHHCTCSGLVLEDEITCRGKRHGSLKSRVKTNSFAKVLVSKDLSWSLNFLVQSSPCRKEAISQLVLSEVRRS